MPEPDIYDIEINYNCNNNCISCPKYKPDKALSFRELKRFFDRNVRPGSRVILTGGEPALHPDFLKIIDYLTGLKAEITILTNGRKFSDMKFAQLVAKRGVRYFQVPVYGPSARVHDAVTRSPASFDEAVTGIKNLLELKSEGYSFNVIIKLLFSRMNYKNLPETAGFIRDEFPAQGMLLMFQVINLTGEAKRNQEHLTISLTEALPYLSKAVKIGLDAQYAISLKEIPVCIFPHPEDYYRFCVPPTGRMRTVYGPVRTLHQRKVDGATTQRRVDGHTVKSPDCKECERDQSCNGVWKGYGNIVGLDELKPIKTLKLPVVLRVNKSTANRFNADTDFNARKLNHAGVKNNIMAARDILILNQNRSRRSLAARYSSALSHDLVRQKTILFGGYSDGIYFNDTWEWDGNNWIPRLTVTSPSVRSGHAILAYDSARQKTVLFGGYNGITHFNDTWEWNGVDWAQCRPVTSPPARSRHAMVYDSARQKTIFFGGYNDCTHFNDIWEWDGTNWGQCLPADSPIARRCFAMAYDSNRHRTILFGGCRGSTYFNDIWEWDGTNWILRSPTTSPMGRDGSALTYDSARQKAVLFGGYNGSIYLNDTWEWDGENWKQILPATSPPARYDHAQAYDSARQKTIVFGGYNGEVNNDIWEWDGTNWTLTYFV